MSSSPFFFGSTSLSLSLFVPLPLSFFSPPTSQHQGDGRPGRDQADQEAPAQDHPAQHPARNQGKKREIENWFLLFSSTLSLSLSFSREAACFPFIKKSSRCSCPLSIPFFLLRRDRRKSISPCLEKEKQKSRKPQRRRERRRKKNRASISLFSFATSSSAHHPFSLPPLLLLSSSSKKKKKKKKKKNTSRSRPT